MCFIGMDMYVLYWSLSVRACVYVLEVYVCAYVRCVVCELYFEVLHHFLYNMIAPLQEIRNMIFLFLFLLCSVV